MVLLTTALRRPPLSGRFAMKWCLAWRSESIDTPALPVHTRSFRNTGANLFTLVGGPVSSVVVRLNECVSGSWSAVIIQVRVSVYWMEQRPYSGPGGVPSDGGRCAVAGSSSCGAAILMNAYHTNTRTSTQQCKQL
ncbi:hypothetical protein E2C01_014352 [Portunus trituberculatus]|uniref:Uncharacterized protein n=1 Tax=Portunus trituberculatus TaxID=210409 RepID=A0A5B7DIZ2_PORTR|nr:hypothetical protein [Portunus trituberculatus]